MASRIYITENNIPGAALERDLLFDTNVWLSIYGIMAHPSNLQTRVYSAFYKKALEAGRKIFLINTVASEYIHVSLREREKLDPHKTTAAKIHQQQDYATWMSDIADEVSYLNNDCEKLDDGFGVADPEKVCRRCVGKTINYNDLIIADLCRSKNLVLVTDDGDFSCEVLDIVTQNTKLIKKFSN
jgi:predicted nucleic acid-binding protein